jgi:hypothetical protein
VNTQFVKVLLDIHCKLKGSQFPAYRVFVNDELFSERTFIWRDRYLTEMLQISAEPGLYQVRIEAVQPLGGKFRIHNYQIEHGPAQWINNGVLEIKNAS